MSWEYDTESAVAETGEGRWSTNLSAAWNIGDNPNGGYAMASSLRAMAQLVAAAEGGAEEKPDPLTITTHFLRPTTGGAPGEIRTELVRSGRLAATATAALTQLGKERLRVIAAFGNLDSGRPYGHSSNTMWDVAPELSIQPPVIPGPEQCRDRVMLEQGVELAILDRLEVRVDPIHAEPGAAGRAQVVGWIRFRDGRPVDTAALVLFADAFPPSLYSLLGRVGWVPTLELTVQVRRRPAPGWVLVRLTTSDLTGGLLVEDGELWDSAGNLVARTRQLAVLLPPGT